VEPAVEVGLSVAASSKNGSESNDNVQPIPLSDQATSNVTPEVSVLDISPLPKRIYAPNAKRRKTTKATLLTSSPHKRSINATLEKTGPKKSNRLSKQKKKAKPKTPRKTKSKTVASRGSTDACLVCGETTNEDWIQCCRCSRWAHEDCADITDLNYYFCDNCVFN